LSARWFWLAFLALYLLTVLPIVRADLPPLVDYPIHLARMHVLIELPRSQALQQYYALNWRALPNLAMDLTVPALVRIMPLEWASKTFILIFLALLPTGAALVHRLVTGQWSVWALFGFLFLYSHLLVWGSLNYLCGLGLALMAFALWLALARQAEVVRVAMASVCALLLFFAHLVACAVFALLIAGHEIGEIWREREVSARRVILRAVAAGLPFVVPAGIFLGGGFGGELGDFAYEGIVRRLGLALFEGHLALDIASFVALGALIAIGYLGGFVTVVPALRGPLLLLGLPYILAPAKLMTAHGLDERFPLAFMLMLAAATLSAGATAKVVRVAVVTGLAMFLVRTAAFASDCERANRLYPRLIAMLDQVPQGGRLAVAFDGVDIGPGSIPINHLPTLAVLRRDALVTTFATLETQQPVIMTPTPQTLRDAARPEELWAALMAGEAGQAKVRDALAGFDAVAVVGSTPFVVPPSPFLAPVGIDPNFAVYRIVH
jgi:hypothetical protein